MWGVEGKIDAGREELRGDAGGYEGAKTVDDMGDAIGHAEKGLVAQRVRESVDEPSVGGGRSGVAERGEGFAGVGFEEEALVILEVDDEAGGGGGGALVGESELADALARGPSVDEVGGAAVGEEAGAGEEFGVGGGDEERSREVGDGLFVPRDGDDADVAGGAEGVGETSDVVQAIGCKIAVVNEEDVHAKKGIGGEEKRASVRSENSG